MKSFDEFSEDLETRRQLLKQRQTDQAASFKEKGAANVCLLYTSDAADE